MSIFEGMSGLLRLAELAGGKVETRIRIQKEAYLIALAGDPSFNPKEFSYHHYGPYSRSLSDVLQAAVSANLLEEEHEGGEDQSFTRYSYRLTDGGRKFLASCPPPSHAFRHVVDVCRGKPWRALELAATVRFLEVNEGRSRSTALDEALELKPATREFVGQAQEVLAHV